MIYFYFFGQGIDNLGCGLVEGMGLNDKYGCIFPIGLLHTPPPPLPQTPKVEEREPTCYHFPSAA